MKLTKEAKNTFVRAVIADVPQVDYHAEAVRIVMAEVVQKLPKEIRHIWNNPQLCGFIRTKGRYFMQSFYIDCPGEMYSLSDTALEALSLLKHRVDEQCERIQTLRSELHAAIRYLSTRNAVAKAFPEFEKYLPSAPPPPDRRVPAVSNVVADFVKAGWKS